MLPVLTFVAKNAIISSSSLRDIVPLNGTPHMVAAKKRLRVYCETTFWRYLAGRQTTDEKIARNQAFTLKWWQEIAPKCDIYISQYVSIESARGNAEMAERRQQCMTSAQFVDGMIESVENLARLLQEGYAVPKTEATDAAHIATASIYGMDVLLTWNCKHMANLVTMPKTAAIVAKAGYECPVIITPDEFLAKKEAFGL